MRLRGKSSTKHICLLVSAMSTSSSCLTRSLMSVTVSSGNTKSLMSSVSLSCLFRAM